MRCVLAVLICTAALTATAQTPPIPEVTLEPHDGKTHFYLGETIRLDMVFRNTTGTPMMLNTMDYGDMSEKVSITPEDGWTPWRGQSGHDFASVQTLTDHPMRIPVRITDGYVIRKPGHYDIRVTEQRVSGGTMTQATRIPETLTNEVGIDVDEMPSGTETELLHEIRNDIANAPADNRGRQIRSAALARLAALQGDEAMEEKIRRVVTEDDDFRSFMPLAMATTRNWQRQLELLQAAWRNPANIPRWDEPGAMDETRRLLAGLPLEGWRMAMAITKPTDAEKALQAAHRRDMEDLLASMPQRTGESRMNAAYYLLEFQGLDDAELQQAHEYAVEEFPHMTTLMQEMLLQTARPPLRDVRLLPALKTDLAKNPTDREPVIAILDLAPEDQKADVIARAVCAPGYPVQIRTLAAWHGDRIPNVDTCLADRLKTAPGDRAGVWNLEAELATRYATPAILSQIKAGWNSSVQDSTMLAVLMRMAPAETPALLDRIATGNNIPFSPADAIYDSLQKPFPPETLEWLRQHVKTTSDKSERIFAYELAHHGEPADEALLEERLAALRKAWMPRAAEIATNTNWTTDAGNARATEIELVSSLRSSTVWKLSPEKLHSLGMGCMSEDCRRAAGAVPVATYGGAIR